MAQIYQKKNWNNERILDSDLNRMEDGIDGRCARAVVEPTGQSGDYDTIQAAINAIGQVGRGSVFLKKGTYVVNASLQIPNDVEYMEIVGETGAVIQSGAGPPTPLLKISVDDLIDVGKFVRVANVIFDGDGDAVSLVEGYQIEVIRFQHCSFVNQGLGAAALYLKNCNDVNIQDCHFEDSSSSYIIHIESCDRVAIQGNTSKNSTGLNIKGNEVTIIGNEFSPSDPGDTAFYLDTCVHAVISNNNIDGFGIVFDIQTSFKQMVISNNVAETMERFIDTTLTALCEDITVIGNIVRECSFAAIEIEHATIDMKNVVVVGNTIADVQREGIKIDRGHGVVIGDNILQDMGQGANNTYSAIILTDCDYSAIKGNTILSETGNKIKHGVEEAGTTDYSNVDGNIVKGAQTSGVSISGGNSQQQDNLIA